MALQLGDAAPDFTAQTTEGTVRLHEYLGDGWGILFSHPADYTPVCTTELGAFAARRDEFTKRNTKLIGVSVDDVESAPGQIGRWPWPGTSPGCTATSSSAEPGEVSVGSGP